MKKILPLVLLVCVTSCGDEFSWSPRPYVGDSVSQSLVNSIGEVVRCDEPRFDSFTCFDPENIAELRTAIGRVENKRKRKEAMEAFRKTFSNKR